MSLPITGIETICMPFANIEQQEQSWKDKALGAICFSASLIDMKIEGAAEIPTIYLQAPLLDENETSTEVWLNSLASSQAKPLVNGAKNAIQYRLSDELLFGVITVPENGVLQNAAESAYRQIFALMEEMDYPYIYRFWNYMADINGISHELERYRQFNVGRKNAFLAYATSVGTQLPAACALGLESGPLTIAFLLGRQAPIAVENPRQISAYEYPEEYGPRAPSFSRATLLHTEQNEILFISGTASIVGHLTMHPLDAVAQTNETLENLDAVINEANQMLGEKKFDLRNIYFRVYIRSASDLSLVRNEMERYMGGAVKAVFIQADICRKELLLEIEATAFSPASNHMGAI
ncbi:MAG: hypothetical protein PSV17_04520 [Methylotenera sp.]|uniref:chorismate transformation enzyme, FkbO/Hyg5 family n=1 Tax=Methylotenera sp. TaxID=2051956 RepID=UPI00248A7911|nr:hypothetical protein [Methylotenera sp.]MDI1308683.1 hypothetical protein [Methylotenera sp.]